MTITPAELLAFVTIVAITVGVVARLGRAHINRRIDVDLEAAVDEAVDAAVADQWELVVAKLDGIRLNQKENSAALGRVHDLEVTIKNGLQDEVKRIGVQVDAIVAAHVWDGNDRRQ